MKLKLKKKVVLAVLAMLYGGVHIPSADAAKVNIVSNTSGGSYRTDIALTGVSQAIKDGDITLGNQINFGIYQQSLKIGTVTTVVGTASNHDARYSASSGATFNTDPVAWIVVAENTGGTDGRYTLVSTKVLDGGVKWDTANIQNWGNLSIASSEVNNNVRAFMNNTMYDSLTNGMSPEQAALIQDSEITTYTATVFDGWDNSTTKLSCNPGTDKLYLMSVQELKEWFAGQSNTNPTKGSGDYPGGTSITGNEKVPWGAGTTEYAKSKGIWVETVGGVTAVDGFLNATYFLRSPSSNSKVRVVHTFGAVEYHDATNAFGGVRPVMQIDLSSLIFTSASSYDYHYGTAGVSKFTKGKGSAVTGGDAVKLETIGSSDTLDLTLYDSTLGMVTTNTTLELSEDDIKLGYSGSGTDKSVAGMLATGDATAGYTPAAWGRMAEGSASGTGVCGLGNVGADTEYSLLVFNEQGTGTSFIGDANVFDGLIKNSGNKTELDLTTTNNASKTFSGEVKVGDGNKLTAKAGQFTGTDAIANNGTITLIGGSLIRDITNNGTLKTAGNVVISSNIGGGTGGTLVVESGTLQYTNTTAGSITNNVEIKEGATLDPDAGVFATGTTVTNYGTLEITGGTLNATIDGKGGDNLVMKNHMTIGATGVVKQAEGSNITVEKTLIESESNDPNKAMFQGIDDADKLDVSKGNLTIEGNITKDKYYVLAEGSAVGTTLNENDFWKLENIDFPGFLLVDYDVNATGGSIALYISSATSKEEGYTSGLAAIQQGNITVAKEFTEETEKHLGLAYRQPNKDTGKYDKEVWANIIHTKEKTEGMELGEGIENNNTAQYNGTIVGTDIYTSKKAITGMALGYIDGNINSQSGRTSTKNDAKYYGVSLYNRVTNGSTALIYDMAYIRGDNDIRQHSNGQEVTADVKTDTYTAGVRYETEVELGRSKLVPFASFRYMRLNNRDYSNSNNTKFETDNQNLYIPKAGIAWTGEFIMPQSAWTWKPHVEGGYVWNLGDRSVASDVWCGSKLANIEYDTADKGSYYVKAGMEFICKNLTAGVFYRYLKGDAVRNSRWNLNVNFIF